MKKKGKFVIFQFGLTNVQCSKIKKVVCAMEIRFIVERNQ